MRQIELNNGFVTLVDDEDYDELMQYHWFAHKEGRTSYAWRHQKKELGKYGKVKMHRQIMKVINGQYLDHVDGDGLNNQKANLRVCSHHQNSMNVTPRKGCSSKYKGVSFHKDTQKWRAYIEKDGQYIHLGCFSSEEDAALAYNGKASELFGVFAKPNVI